jgi:hypothetical protein
MRGIGPSVFICQWLEGRRVLGHSKRGTQFNSSTAAAAATRPSGAHFQMQSFMHRAHWPPFHARPSSTSISEPPQCPFQPPTRRRISIPPGALATDDSSHSHLEGPALDQGPPVAQRSRQPETGLPDALIDAAIHDAQEGASALPRAMNVRCDAMRCGG